MPFDGVADVIGKHGYASHFANIVFKCAMILSERGVAGGPSFSINKYIGMYFLQFRCYTIHCCSVMDSHQVETESVYVVFVSPVFY